MDLGLRGKSAIVTGGSMGIGTAIARELAREGVNVAVNYRKHDTEAKALVAEIEALGQKGLAIQADVGKSADVNRMFEEVQARFERLDILVNNAGVQTWKPLLELTEAEWDRVIDTNLKGCFLCTQQAALRMKESGGGSIINIGSGCNKVPFPGLVDYTASKGGVLALTRELAIVHSREKIRVNALCPGPLHTELLMKFLDTAEKKQRRLVHIPMGRFGLAREMAYAALYLASDESSYVTGSEFVVDGGITAAYVTPE